MHTKTILAAVVVGLQVSCGLAQNTDTSAAAAMQSMQSMPAEMNATDSAVSFVEAQVRRPLVDEHGDVIYEPMPRERRHGALELWSQRRFHGHRALYGLKEGQCDTVETYTYGRTGFGKSARVVEKGMCCRMFTAPGCNGHSIVVAGDMVSFEPYGMDNKVKSVNCRDCSTLYPDTD